MKQRWIAVLGGVVLATAVLPPLALAQQTSAPSEQPAAQDKPAIETDKQKLDYALGAQMGRNLKNQGFEADADFVVQGLRDARRERGRSSRRKKCAGP